MNNRHMTRTVKIRDLVIGGGNPILVQSMTKTDTRDVNSTVAQIKRLEKIGCEIVRLAILDEEAAIALSKIRKQTNSPLVADIHFDYKLALASLKSGADKLRINPGNIGDEIRIREVVEMAKDRQVPIRIGVNSGSISKEIEAKYGHTSRAVFESLASHVKILENLNFFDIILSVKCSDVKMSIESYLRCAEEFNYPLHLGITESGPIPSGLTKSSVGLGIMLNCGIGDTIRVSLTDEPEKEVDAAYDILRSLGLRKRGADIISCPMCGRCEVDMRPVVEEVRDKLKNVDVSAKVAVMGCEVNGPKEAKHADYGIACGKSCGLLFKHGEIVGKIEEKRMADAIFDLIEKDLRDK